MQVSAISSSPAAPLAVTGLVGQSAIQAGQSPAQQRHTAAIQFEAILLRQFLQQSVGTLAGGKESGGNGVYGYLLTDLLATKLADGGGFGLAHMLEQQLTPRGERSTAAGASSVAKS
jgi:flagellar protein FlgJ